MALYAKTAGGNWSAAGTWSATSPAGGDSAGPPTAADDVFFQAGSGNVTVDSSAAVAKSVDFTGYVGTLTWASFTLTVSGSVTFVSGMSFSGMTSSTTLTINGVGTLTTGGKTMPPNVNLTATGTVTLGDDFNGFANIVSNITLTTVASFDLNGHVVKGNSTINRILVQCITFGGAGSVLNATNTSFQNADFKDLALTSASSLNLSAITGLSGDCGGNSIVGGGATLTFTSPATQTATMSTNKNWSDVTIWTTRIPLPQDNMSGASITGGTLTADMPRLCKNLDMTGASGSPTLSLTSTSNIVYGSITFISGMTLTSTASMSLQGRSSHTITMAGKSFAGTFLMQAFGGTYTQQDAFTISGNGLTQTFGTWVSNNFSFTGSSINSTSGVRGLTFGTSTITLVNAATGTNFNVTSTGMTLSATSSTIVFSAVTANTLTFAGAGLTYGTFTANAALASGIVIITGANTFGTINIGAGRQLTMPASTTNTINQTFGLNGVNNGYEYLPGAASNYVSSPDAAPIRITGDITIDVNIAATAWTPATLMAFCSKWGNAGSRSYEFLLNIAGTLRFITSVDGTALTTDTSSTVGTGFTAGTLHWVRVSMQVNDSASHNIVKFYTSPDGTTWSQLGATVTNTGATTIFNSAQGLEIGSNTAGANLSLQGNVYEVKLYNSYLQTSAGTPVLDANFATKTFGANSFTESSANAATMTINGVPAQCGDGRVSLISSSSGTAATITKAGGIVSCDYLVIKDSAATIAHWYAGTHSVSVSGNSGWIFTAPPQSGGGGSGAGTGGMQASKNLQNLRNLI